MSYSYIKVGEQKVIPQSKQRGKRINILGIYEPKKSFNYARSIGSLKKENLVNIWDKEADEAEKYQKQKRRDTVIILDNYSVDTSGLIKAKRKEWEQKG